MTLHQLTTALRSLFAPRDTFAAALAPFPLHEDDPNAGSEAEYWLDVCHEQCNIPLVNDPKARAILANEIEKLRTLVRDLFDRPEDCDVRARAQEALKNV
jgi:hypothetical protein